MITYETYCKIIRIHQDQLRTSQICSTLCLDERTVEHWIKEGCYRQRKPSIRPSVLNQYKPHIIRWLETYPYSSVQIVQRLREEGYRGGITILKDYVRKI